MSLMALIAAFAAGVYLADRRSGGKVARSIQGAGSGFRSRLQSRRNHRGPQAKDTGRSGGSDLQRYSSMKRHLETNT